LTLDRNWDLYLPLLHHFGECFRFSAHAIMLLQLEFLGLHRSIDDVLDTFSPWWFPIVKVLFLFAMLFVVCCLSPDRIVGRVLFRGRKAAKVSIENKMGRRVSVNIIVLFALWKRTSKSFFWRQLKSFDAAAELRDKGEMFRSAWTSPSFMTAVRSVSIHTANFWSHFVWIREMCRTSDYNERFSA